MSIFTSLCSNLGVKKLTTTARHPQIDGQVGRYNQTLVSRLRLYIDENQKNSDIYIQPLTYAYTSQVHRLTRDTPYSHIFRRHPLGLTTTASPSAPPTDAASATKPTVLGQKLLAQLSPLKAKVSATLLEKQKRYKSYFDRKARAQPGFQVGQTFSVTSHHWLCLMQVKSVDHAITKYCRG